jgi:hypothetical protein
MWVTYQLSASSGYDAEFHEGCYQKHTNPLNCRTSSSDNSGYHAKFHEGHGTVGEQQGRGTAWARHGVCELAFSLYYVDYVIDFVQRSKRSGKRALKTQRSAQTEY